MTNSNEQATIAMYHYFLAAAVLERLSSLGGNAGDTFGEGDDSFVISLFPYTELVHGLVDAFDDVHSNKWQDSYLFELMSFVAKQFLFLAFRDQENNEAVLPDLNELEPMIEVYLLNLAK